MTKSWLAVGGFVICAALSAVAWANGFTVVAIILLAIAVLAIVDVGWQRWKQARGISDD